MGPLGESVKNLRDTIKRQEYQISNYNATKNQEHQLTNYNSLKRQELQLSNHNTIKHQEHNISNNVNSQDFKEAQLFPKGDYIDENERIFQNSSNGCLFQFGTHLCNAESNTSQSSHWSCSLEMINSSIGDLKMVLKGQDTQVIRLIAENEQLKNHIKKIEKELRKQKFLLKAERETFEQYKRDTFQGVKKQRSEESQKRRPNKNFQEIVKLKSELAHYRQMYVDQSHTVTRLSKLVTSLKTDKILLKGKMLQQEQRANKFIMEMAHRFEVSRKDFNIVTSKKSEEKAITSTELAVHEIADRNARLAHDNTMLKLEINFWKKKLLKLEENKIECLTGRSVQHGKNPNSSVFEDPDHVKCGNSETTNTIKVSVSELSGLSNVSFQNCKCAVKTSVTSLINRNKTTVSMWQPQSASKGLDPAQLKSAAGSAEDVRLMRVCSAPQLTVSCCSLTEDKGGQNTKPK